MGVCVYACVYCLLVRVCVYRCLYVYMCGCVGVYVCVLACLYFLFVRVCIYVYVFAWFVCTMCMLVLECLSVCMCVGMCVRMCLSVCECAHGPQAFGYSYFGSLGNASILETGRCVREA